MSDTIIHPQHFADDPSVDADAKARAGADHTTASLAEETVQEQSDPSQEMQPADDIDPDYVKDPVWQDYMHTHNARFHAKSAAFAKSCAQTAKIYPAFDLKEEMQNPRFLRLIDAGLSVRESYELLHRDALLKQAVQAAAEATRKRIYADLAAKRNRVEENGVSPALITKKDPASMSRAQRELIAKRVMRGEKVTF